MGHLMGQADGQQDMGGVKGGGGTGRAGGGADALGVQVEEERLTFHALKDKGRGAGQAVHRIAGEAGAGAAG